VPEFDHRNDLSDDDVDDEEAAAENGRTRNWSKGAMLEEFMSEFWNEYDKDNNGILDKVEFKKFLNDTILNEKYSQGKFTAAQMSAKYEELFTQFDTNKDGQISLDEMQGFVKHLFAYHFENEGESCNISSLENYLKTKKKK
jgi:Ca2+-binding EF-hand superfamily protein